MNLEMVRELERLRGGFRQGIKRNRQIKELSFEKKEVNDTPAFNFPKREKSRIDSTSRTVNAFTIRSHSRVDDSLISNYS